MTRAWFRLLIPLCFVSLVSACKSGAATSPPPGSGAGDRAVAPVEAETGELAIIAVPQRVIPIDPMLWEFDAEGRFVAAEIDGECGIWEIESGRFLGPAVGEVDICDDWYALDIRDPSERSAEGVRVSVSAGQLELVRGETRVSKPCKSCEQAWAWAPVGNRLATCDGRLLEIWDADTGAVVHSETLDLGLDGKREPEETLMAWTERGLVVALSHGITGSCEQLDPSYVYCEYGEDDEPLPIQGYAVSSFWWAGEGQPPVTQPELFRSIQPPDVYADPSLRWLVLEHEEEFERDGVATNLTVLGTMGEDSELGWVDYHEGGPTYERSGGRWRVDAATQWLETYSVEAGGPDTLASFELGWQAIVAEPTPAAYAERVYAGDGYEVWGEGEVYAAAGGAAALRWEACADYEYEEQEGEPCESLELSVGDCELFDVSPQLSLALVGCAAGLQLIDAGRGTPVATLPYDLDVAWRWGRGNWLALFQPGGKLGVVDLASGRILYERDDVESLPEVPLAPEQDRLVIGYADRLELVTGATGETLIEVPGRIWAAALSPDGRRVAVLADERARVIEIADGAEVSSFAVGDAFGLAWRQDGAALFYGYDWPTHAVDPDTGELLGAIEHPAFDMMDPGELDPSWRWLHRPDGSVTRILDFARIELGPTWARTDTGLFDGDLGDLPEGAARLGFRVGDDPHAVPEWTARELEPWLRRPGLVGAFFAGDPLPPPTIPAGEYALVRGDK